MNIIEKFIKRNTSITKRIRKCSKCGGKPVFSFTFNADFEELKTNNSYINSKMNTMTVYASGTWKIQCDGCRRFISTLNGNMTINDAINEWNVFNRSK